MNQKNDEIIQLLEAITPVIINKDVKVLNLTNKKIKINYHLN